MHDDVDEGDQGIEMGARQGPKDSNEYVETDRGGPRIFQQLEADLPWGELLRGNARANHNRTEQQAPEKFAQECWQQFHLLNLLSESLYVGGCE